MKSPGSRDALWTANTLIGTHSCADWFEPLILNMPYDQFSCNSPNVVYYNIVSNRYGQKFITLWLKFICIISSKYSFHNVHTNIIRRLHYNKVLDTTQFNSIALRMAKILWTFGHSENNTCSVKERFQKCIDSQKNDPYIFDWITWLVNCKHIFYFWSQE